MMDYYRLLRHSHAAENLQYRLPNMGAYWGNSPMYWVLAGRPQLGPKKGLFISQQFCGLGGAFTLHARKHRK